MCVVALALKAHPDWPILLIGNRDEFHARPSAPLARWGNIGEPLHHVIGGRDLQSGGSWLGVSESGRLAVVTNIRSDIPPSPDKASRGALISNFLSGEGIYAELQAGQLNDFNAFHLLTVSADGLARHFSNKPAAIESSLANGLYGLSNTAIGEPCSRNERLKAQLQNWLTGAADDCDALFALLREEEISGPDDLPNFLNGDVYGTRCSTIVAVDRQGCGRIIERRFAAGGIDAGQSEFRFVWESRNP